MQKKGVILGVLVLVLFVSVFSSGIVSAGWWSDFVGKITGNVVLQEKGSQRFESRFIDNTSNSKVVFMISDGDVYVTGVRLNWTDFGKDCKAKLVVGNYSSNYFNVENNVQEGFWSINQNMDRVKVFVEAVNSACPKLQINSLIVWYNKTGDAPTVPIINQTNTTYVSSCTSTLCTLYEGQKVGPYNYSIQIRSIESDSVTLDIEGTSSSDLSVGRVYYVGDVTIKILNISYSSRDSGLSMVVFSHSLNTNPVEPKPSCDENYKIRAMDFANEDMTDVVSFERYQNGEWQDIKENVQIDDSFSIGNVEMTVTGIYRLNKTVELSVASPGIFDYKYNDYDNVFVSIKSSNVLFNGNREEYFVVSYCGNATAKCTDSDGGLNYYENGKVLFNYLGSGKFAEFADSCMDVSSPNTSYPTKACFGSACVLSEYACGEDKNLNTKDYTCPNGCEDGACIKDDANTTCTPRFICQTSPAICPASGIQTKKCEDFQCNTESTSEEVKCNPGECAGCELEGKCVPYGFRTAVAIYNDNRGQFNLYCEIDGSFREQKVSSGGQWATCQNNYECFSNLCSGGECVDLQAIAKDASALKNAWVSITCKVTSFLGIDASYEQCMYDSFGVAK